MTELLIAAGVGALVVAMVAYGIAIYLRDDDPDPPATLPESLQEYPL